MNEQNVSGQEPSKKDLSSNISQDQFDKSKVKEAQEGGSDEASFDSEETSESDSDIEINPSKLDNSEVDLDQTSQLSGSVNDEDEAGGIDLGRGTGTQLPDDSADPMKH